MANFAAGKYELRGCGSQCSLNPKNLPGQTGQLIHEWLEAGDTYFTVKSKAKALGVNVSNGALGRHRSNHMVALVEDVLLEGEDANPASDLDVLELIIRKGGRNLRSKQINVGVEGVLRAIDLKYKLTQGNVFESFLAKMGEALDEEERGGAPEEKTDGSA